MEDTKNLLTIKQASDWASKLLKKNVTPSNISYLIQYGRIRKIGSNGDTLVAEQDLSEYYESYLGKREAAWKGQLGEDLNWSLSFDQLKEADTTKHVHRLHPYKGKFIPQLVEYFLDGHVDEYKKEIYFKKGDIVLDPFCGSGTTLVQANELGMHAVGIDVSAFKIKRITKGLKQFIADSKTIQFENKLIQELAKFNNKYFPSPEYKYKVALREINGDEYGAEKEKEFLPIFLNLIREYDIKLMQNKCNSFLDKWYLWHIRTEIDFVCDLVKQIKNPSTRKVISIILSRTVRSCRATTHADLATLKNPVTTTYYCSKHGKVCKPLFSIMSWWERYSKDTINRLRQFNNLRTDTDQICLTGDSKTIDISNELDKKNPVFSELLKNQKIKGIFSSPPYVGLIDYHDQHAYAYDLFGFERRDELEIGHLLKGQGKEARNSYVQGISDVLNNCKRFLVEDYNILLVANDKYNLYPIIAENLTK